MNEANERTTLRQSAVAQVAETPPAAERARRRRIGLHHMAFIRGVYEGLDVGTLAEQYLGNLGDRRRARSTLRWLVEELANAARKRGDSAGARLLRLPTARLLDAPVAEIELAPVAHAGPAPADSQKTVLNTPTSSKLSPVVSEDAGSSEGVSIATTPTTKSQSPRDAVKHDASVSTATAEHETLEAFREAHDPEGVYSEAELIALYEEARRDTIPAGHMITPTQSVPGGRHATSKATDGVSMTSLTDRPLVGTPMSIVNRAARVRARNQRLRTRRRELLDRLEAALVEPPRLHHFIGDWIDPALAQRLEAIDIRTVGDLLSLINRRGFHWYRDVPRVGLRAAQRLQDWLTMNAIDLGAQIARHAAIPQRQWSAPLAASRLVTSEHIAAIEYFTPQDAHIAADRDVLLRLLARYQHSPSTFRCFRLQGERLLLWAALRRQRALGDLSDEDVRDYFAFMQAPEPEWCGPKVERGLPAWRPFEGPVSDASLRIARRALKALFAQLVLDGVLSRNPFDAQLVALDDTFTVDKSVASAPVAQQPLKRLPSVGRLPQPIHLARMRLLAQVTAVGGMRMSDAATLRIDQAEALWGRGEMSSAEGRYATKPALTASQRQMLWGAVADYLALRKAQTGAIDPSSPLFVRHTANGVDASAHAPFVPAGTLVRVLSRYRALGTDPRG
jgi:hypothetical protein